jgi:thiamine biosynthesis protein ThiS
MEHLKINGKLREFPLGQLPDTLAQLLRNLEIDSAAVVAEIDGRIVPRKDFAETKLNTGQAIELVRFVPGG